MDLYFLHLGGIKTNCSTIFEAKDESQAKRIASLYVNTNTSNVVVSLASTDDIERVVKSGGIIPPSVRLNSNYRYR